MLWQFCNFISEIQYCTSYLRILYKNIRGICTECAEESKTIATVAYKYLLLAVSSTTVTKWLLKAFFLIANTNSAYEEAKKK